MTRFYSRKAAVPLGQGQTLGYTAGKGYYAKGPVLTDEQFVGKKVDTTLDPIIKDLQTRGTQTTSNLRGIYEALAQANAGIAPQIAGDYQTAEANTGAFAKGFQDALNADSGDKAAQANIILAQNGSPQTVQPGNPGSVLFGLGGMIPGQALAREGAGFTAAARSLPAQARTLGAAEQANALGSMEDEIRKIEAERPGLIDKALSELQSARAQQSELELKRQVAEQEFGLDQSKLDLAQNKLQLDQSIAQDRSALAWEGLKFKKTQDKKKAQAAAAEGAQPNAALSKVYGYVVDHDGRAILDSQGKKIPVAKSKKTADTLDPSQRSVIVGRAQTAGVKSLSDLTDRIWSNVDAEVEDDAEAKTEYQRRLRLNYGTAMRVVVQAIGPHLRALGWTQAQIKAKAREIVSHEIPRGK